MSLHRRAARKDDNHRAVVEALRAVGCSVQDLSGAGVPDLLVGRNGATYLLEVKNPKGWDTIEEAQKLWHARWRGHPVRVVRSPAEALAAVGATPSVYPANPKEKP